MTHPRQTTLGEINPMSEIINVIWALLLVLSVIGGLAYLAKKSGYLPGSSLLPGRQARLAILENKALDARHRVVIVSKDGEEYFLALGPGVITLLDSPEKKESFKQTLNHTDMTGNTDV